MRTHVKHLLGRNSSLAPPPEVSENLPDKFSDEPRTNRIKMIAEALVKGLGGASNVHVTQSDKTIHVVGARAARVNDEPLKRAIRNARGSAARVSRRYARAASGISDGASSRE